MQFASKVLLNLVHETLRFPRFGPERNGDRLAKVIQLEAATPNGVDDGSIVDHLVVQSQFKCSDDDVAVSSGPTACSM